MFFSSLRIASRSLRRTSLRKPASAARCLEQLEARWLLSTFTVSNLNDSGAGSLRQAILSANLNSGADVIDFSVAGTIQLTSAALPAITDAVNVNGTTAPGFQQKPVVAVDFHGFGGLKFAAGSDNSTLSSLDLIQASSAGVAIDAAGTITITGNFVGVGFDGATVAANLGDGLNLHNSSGNTITLNTIAGNGGNGIQLDGSSNNTLQTNSIGTDFSGTLDRGNSLNGILVTNASLGNTLGGTATGGNDPTQGVYVRPPQGNLISGNDGNGVLINSQSTANVLSGNFIGTTTTGNAPLGNALDGVVIDGADRNSLIGCLSTDNPFIYYNLVDGNGGNGLRVNNSNDTTIQANFFGLGANNQTPVGNLGNGVVIEGSSAGTIMGGKIPLGNVVAANGLNGVVLQDTSSGYVSFNTFCGVAAFQPYTNLGNHLDGFLITSTGGGNVIRTSVISENGSNGLEISGSATGVKIAEDIIGLNTDGMIPFGNKKNGIEVNGQAHGITIGGTKLAFSIIPHNTISGNAANGVAITGSAHDVEIDFSNIGTSVRGQDPLGNAQAGVFVGAGTTAITIGSADPTLPTVISANVGDGVQLSGTHGNTVTTTLIGVDAQGDRQLPNGGDGVHLLASSGNTISLNTISGNDGNGIQLDGSDSNTIQTNSIGTDGSGMDDFGNALNGILVTNLSKNNTIGGTATGGNNPTQGVYHRPPQGNLISGNNGNGVLINSKATGNVLSGNFIGTVATGNFSLGNSLDGVVIDGADGNSLIGCLKTDNPFVYYNVVSGNRGNGLRVNNSNDTTIQANFFGLGADNQTPVGNQLNGVVIEGSSAGTIMGGQIPLGNVVAANGQNGVVLQGTSSGYVSFNTFCGVAAFQPYTNLGNRLDGFLITSTGGSNVIRTSVISENGSNGLEISGSATGVKIAEDIIGLNTDGMIPFPNKKNGIEVNGQAHGITIGGTKLAFSIIPHNTISGNAANGVAITGSAHDVEIDFSNIGTSVRGQDPLGNGQAGVFVGPGTTAITIGSTDPTLPTVISGNTGDGVQLNGTHGNSVVGSLIGIDSANVAALPNGGSGVHIINSSSNIIGGTPPASGSTAGSPANVIAFNKGNGVLVESGNGNGILANSIYGNVQPGIELKPGANLDQAAPVLTSVQSTPTGVHVTGSLKSTASTQFTIEYFASDEASPAGRVYLGSQTVTTNSAGVASLAFNAAPPPVGDRFITATATDPNNNTSEFSTFPDPTLNDLIGLLRVYSLVNTDMNVHFYTTNRGEHDALLSLIDNNPTPHHPWQDAGANFTSFALFQTPPSGANVAYVQRLYNTQTGEHYYTLSLGEAAALSSTTRQPADGGPFVPGWIWENQEQGTSVTDTNAFQGYMYLPNDPAAKSSDNPIGPAGTMPVFRLYQQGDGSTTQPGDHVLSNDPSQYNALLSQAGWTEHGMLGFAVQIPSLSSASTAALGSTAPVISAETLAAPVGSALGSWTTVVNLPIAPNVGLAPQSSPVLEPASTEATDASTTSSDVPDVNALDTFWQTASEALSLL